MGFERQFEYEQYKNLLKNHLICTDGGTVQTRAGTFTDCLRITFDITGMKPSHAYRGGRKIFDFAPGIGIVRFISDMDDGVNPTIYELTSYEGTGEGYMPFSNGLFRRYEAIGLTDGYFTPMWRMRTGI